MPNEPEPEATSGGPPPETPLPPSDPFPAVGAAAASGDVVAGSKHVTQIAGGDIVGRDKIIGYTAEQVSLILAEVSRDYQLKPFDGRCPYKGLEAFGEDDAEFFFGRTALIAELAARVQSARGLVIGGPSGSGKSSLVRAGLIPALKQNPRSGNWLYATLTPGRDPLERLALAITRLARSPAAGDYIRTQAATQPAALHQAAEAALSDRDDQRVVLFVDQFEEIFSPLVPETMRAAFLSVLTQAVSVEAGRVTVLLAVRSDFVPQFANYPALNQLLNRQFHQVSVMQPAELTQAIGLPAQRVGLRVDPDLIAQVVQDVGEEPGALPLMQFALVDLFEAQQMAGGVMALTRAAYLARGGLHKALEQHANAAFGKLSADEQQLARLVFSGLVQVGRGAQTTRRTALFAELVPAGSDPSSVEAVVRRLADARLLTTAEREAGLATDASARAVTLAHEKLLDAWPWLRQLVNANRQAIELQNQIAQDAQVWDEHGRDPGYLYTGGRLATAREWLDEGKVSLSDLGQAFVRAGVEAREAARRARERQRNLLVAGALVIAAALAVLGLFGLNSSREAQRQQRISRARELAAAAQANLAIDPERSILLAMQAVSTTFAVDGGLVVPEAEEALHQALQASRVRLTLTGPAAILAVAFSPDGVRLATADEDGTAQVWDATTGRMILTLSKHQATLHDIAFSPDGTRLATASEDGTTIVWDAATGEALFTLSSPTPHAAEVMGIAFSPDGLRLATASKDYTAKVWDAATGQELFTLSQQGSGETHEDWVNSVVFSPDGMRLATASEDGTVTVWDAATGLEQLSLPRQAAAVYSLAFSPDGEQLATASADGTATVWDAATGQELFSLTGHAAAVNDIAFSPDGERLATASADGSARGWVARTGRGLFTLAGHSRAVNGLAFSPDGLRLVTASEDATAKVWHAGGGEELRTLPMHADWIYSLAFSPDGTRLATASRDRTAKVWDAASGLEIFTLNPPGGAFGLVFSPEGTRLATANVDGTATVWDAASGQAMLSLSGHADTVRVIAFSPDGTRLATASWDNTAKVWDTASGHALLTLRGHGDRVQSLAFSPEGTRLATASYDGTAIVWEAYTGEALFSLAHDQARVYAVTFSPDGTRLATASADGTARIWDASTGRELHTLLGHTADVLSVAFSPNGERLATASSDGTAKLWDAATGQELLTLTSQSAALFTLAFSPDGQRLALAGEDGSGRFYAASIEALIALGRTRLTRDWMLAECQKYLQLEACPSSP